jgi:PAS domain S-box-containing protein
MGSGSDAMPDVCGVGGSVSDGRPDAGESSESAKSGIDFSRDSSSDAKALLDTLDDLVFIVDEEGFILEVNRAVEAALDVSREKLKNTRVLQLLPEGRRDEIGRILKAMAYGEVSCGLIPVVAQSGDVLELETRGSHGVWQGKPVYFGVSRDASERMLTQRLLEESRARLELALEGADLGMWDWDIPTGKVHYGKKWAQILGYSPDEVEPGMAFWERLVHPDDKPHVTEILQRHLKGRVPHFECEYRMRNRSDQWIWILAKGRVTGRGPDGRALRMTGTYMDITHRKEAELAHRLFRQIIEHTSEAVAINDKMGRLVYVNPAYEALFGRPFHEAVNLGQFEGFTPQSVEILTGEVMPRLCRGEGWEGELDAIDAAGRRFTLWKRADAICDDEGNLMYAFGVMHDATEQKEAEARRLDMERRLLTSQKHESLGAMASAVAHHFNNLLMGVLGNLELLQDGLIFDEKGLGILAQAQRAARRATELSRVMTTYMGQGIGMRTTRDLSRLVMGVLPEIQDSLPVQVDWQTMLAEGLPKVLVDADALHKVIRNLATNALESLDETGGMVVLRTGTAACDEECLARAVGGEGLPPGDYVFLEICDDGCGMPAPVVARMFDPFFSTKFTGRGLGLASVLGIVRAHQGAILVESHPGAGTTVKVLLPAAAGLHEQP